MVEHSPSEPGSEQEVEGLLRSLNQWAAEARADQARSQRIAGRWQEQVLAESVSLTALLRDLAGSAAVATVTTESGRSYCGRVTAVGNDFCSLGQTQGPEVTAALRSVTSVLVDVSPRRVAKTGDLHAQDRRSLLDLLTDLANERARIRFVLRGSPEVRSGEIRGAGADVITVIPDARVSSTLVVPLSGLTEVWVNQ